MIGRLLIACGEPIRVGDCVAIPPCSFEYGHCMDSHVKKTLDVDCKQPVDLRLRRASHASWFLRDRSIVNQDIEAAPMPNNVLNSFAYRVAVSYITDHCNRPPTCFDNLLDTAIRGDLTQLGEGSDGAQSLLALLSLWRSAVVG